MKCIVLLVVICVALTSSVEGFINGLISSVKTEINSVVTGVKATANHITSGDVFDAEKSHYATKTSCCLDTGKHLKFPDLHIYLLGLCDFNTGFASHGDKDKGWRTDDTWKWMSVPCNCGRFVVDDDFDAEGNDYAVNYYGACIECPTNCRPTIRGFPAQWPPPEDNNILNEASNDPYIFNEHSACRCEINGKPVGFDQYYDKGRGRACPPYQFWNERHKTWTDSREEEWPGFAGPKNQMQAQCEYCGSNQFYRSIHPTEDGKSCDCGQEATYNYKIKRCQCKDKNAMFNYFSKTCRSCPSGATYDVQLNKCDCPDNKEYIVTTNVCCAENEFKYNGKCESCPENSKKGTGNTCICNNGFTFDTNSRTCYCRFATFVFGQGTVYKDGVMIGDQCQEKKTCSSTSFYNHHTNECCYKGYNLLIGKKCMSCPFGSVAKQQIRNSKGFTIDQTCECNSLNGVQRAYKRYLSSGISYIIGKCLKCPEGVWGQATKDERLFYTGCKCPNGWIFDQSMDAMDDSHTGNCFCPEDSIINGQFCTKCPTRVTAADGSITIGSVPSDDRSTCVCEAGFDYDFATNKCICSSGKSIIKGGMCVKCPYGFSVKGECPCPSVNEGDTKYIYNITTNECQCPQNYVLQNGKCVCDNLSRIDDDIFLYEMFVNVTNSDGTEREEKVCKQISFETLFDIQDLLAADTSCNNYIDLINNFVVDINNEIDGSTGGSSE